MVQAVAGVVIGVPARPGTLVAVARDWLPVLLVGAGTLAFSMGAGLLLGRRGPGRGGDGGPWYTGLLLTAGCAAVGLPPARVLRVPAGGLLGPMTVALVLTLTGVAGGAAPPAGLVELAYAVIGWQAGVRFTRRGVETGASSSPDEPRESAGLDPPVESLRVVAGLLPAAVALIAAVVVACAALGALLSWLTGVTPLEGYPATTPGGIYAVLATAISSGVDVAFVVAVQVLRVIVMLLVAPAIARWVSRR